MKKIFVIVFLGCLMYGQSVDCVGNSITANGYPEIADFWMVQDNYEWRVYNYGVPGITVSIDGFDYINTQAYQDVMNRKSEHIIVMLGANDRKIVLASGIWDFEQDYRLLINNFRTVSRKVFLGTITYQIYSNENFVIDDINEVVKKVASDYDLSIIDFNNILGVDSVNFLQDGVHPSTEGKYKLAKLAFDVLKSYPIYELGIDDEYWEAVEDYKEQRKIGWFGCSAK